MPKTEDKGSDKKMKDIAKCFKMVQSLMVITMYSFDYENFAYFVQKPEKPEESKGKKKKAAKNDEASILIKFAENLNVKIFEEKYEKTAEQ